MHIYCLHFRRSISSHTQVPTTEGRERDHGRASLNGKAGERLQSWWSGRLRAKSRPQWERSYRRRRPLISCPRGEFLFLKPSELFLPCEMDSASTRSGRHAASLSSSGSGGDGGGRSRNLDSGSGIAARGRMKAGVKLAAGRLYNKQYCKHPTWIRVAITKVTLWILEDTQKNIANNNSPYKRLNMK